MTPLTEPRAYVTLLALFTAAMHIRAEYRGPRWQVYVFKPATTALLLLIAWLGGGEASSLYRAGVLLGLAFSLAGDVFLMLPSDRFVAGLGAFLAAHLAYLAAFLGTAPGRPFSAALILYGAYAVGLLAFLWPRLGKMCGPVLVYGAVLALMAWRAYERWAALGTEAAALATVGAGLFVLSDSALAVNRFRRPFHAAQAVVLTTYYAAQWFLALSA